MRTLKVLRVYHSGVVAPWRRREEELRSSGVDVTLVSPLKWDEGGSIVGLTGAQPWVVPCRTIGRHPYLFIYNPFTLARLMWTHTFDVLDFHEEPASLAALELRLVSWIRHRRAPVLLYGAQNIEKRYPIPFRWIERASLRRAAAIYPCSSDAGDILVRKGFRGLVEQLDLGVDTIDFQPGDSPSESSSERFTIGYVGRLEEHKGVQVIISALALLPETFHLAIIGDGPFRDQLVQQVPTLQLDARVTFRGHVNREDLPEAYRGFDAVVVPSQARPNWIEQFGRVAVESMAAGVPLLVADTGSLPEVVGDAAVVVPARDPQRWADELMRLEGDEAARWSLREAGLQRAKSFQWSTIAAQQHALYESVAK